MKYFTFAPKTKLEKVAKQFKTKSKAPATPAVPDIEIIRASLSGKIATVRFIKEHLAQIKKPSKQTTEFLNWISEYESQLFAEWNKFNN